jgi:hypothetical protein
MQKSEQKNFKCPDEVRTFEKGKMELVNIGGGTVGLLSLEPGWQWSKHVKSIAKTEFCEAPHFQYQLSGRLHILMADGSEFETVAGDISRIPSGHDAWVVGDEPVVAVDWAGAAHYAEGVKP